MINYNKNDLINECLAKYYETFSITLDTADYVPQSFNKRILRYIFKNMKKQFRLIDKEDKEFQKKLCKNGSDRVDPVAKVEKMTEKPPQNSEGQPAAPSTGVSDHSPQPESETPEYEPAELDRLENLINKYS